VTAYGGRRPIKLESKRPPTHSGDRAEKEKGAGDDEHPPQRVHGERNASNYQGNYEQKSDDSHENISLLSARGGHVPAFKLAVPVDVRP
jgi:hypothetical protein